MTIEQVPHHQTSWEQALLLCMLLCWCAASCGAHSCRGPWHKTLQATEGQGGVGWVQEPALFYTERYNIICAWHIMIYMYVQYDWMEFESACTEDACTSTYILCGSLGLAVLCSWGTCCSSHVYMYFILHSILVCGHPHLDISSLHLQVHSTPEPLRWRGETRRRFFSWYGAVLPIRWVSKLCWHPNC